MGGETIENNGNGSTTTWSSYLSSIPPFNESGLARMLGILSNGWSEPTGWTEREINCYVPISWEGISALLDKRWVQIAITVSCIGIICLFAPSFPALLVQGTQLPLRVAIGFLQPILKSLSLYNLVFNNTLITVSALSAFIYCRQYAGRGAGIVLVYALALTLSNNLGVPLLGLCWNPNADPRDGYLLQMMSTPLYAMILGPLYEEFLFRMVLPYLFKGFVCKGIQLAQLVTKRDLKIEKDWIITKTEAIFCSVIYGLTYFSKKRLFSLPHALLQGWVAVHVLHPLKDKRGYNEKGFEAAAGAHMMMGTLSFGLSGAWNSLLRRMTF